MNRKNKKAFDLTREMALRSRIADFALMLNTTEKVDLVRALASSDPKEKKDLVLKTFGEKVVFVHYFNILNELLAKVEEAKGVRPEEVSGISSALDALAAPLGDGESASVAAAAIREFYTRHQVCVPHVSKSLVVFDRIGNSLNMLEDAVNELIEGKEVA